MVKIFLDSNLISYVDWAIWYKDNDEMMLTVTYSSGKKYTRPYEEWQVEPIIEKKGEWLFDKKRNTYAQIERAIEVGKKYLLIKYPYSEKEFILKTDNAEIVQETDLKSKDVFKYFNDIAAERLENANNANDKIIAQNIVSQFDKVIPCAGTALHAYINQEIVKYEPKKTLIFPFGINETQLQAVKNAFMSQLSIIEGPPGTGKTQTILNIIANIVLDGKKCAVVSNNNSAVENVYEKLAEKQLDFMVARLGKNENKEEFFDTLTYNKPDVPLEEIKLNEIQEKFNKIESYLTLNNHKAQVVSEIQEICIEKKYLEEWLNKHPDINVNYIEKYRLEHTKIVDLYAYLNCLKGKALSFKDKWELLIHYGIFKNKFLNDVKDRESFLFSLQYTFYCKMLNEKNSEKERLEKELAEVNYDEELKKLVEGSMHFFYRYVAEEMPEEIWTFTVKDYRQKFSEFMKCFPVIGSSSHSLMSSIKNGYLLDYVIIDEASQQDLVPGVLCLGCAKNVIVVGDRKQLSHIPTSTKIVSPHKLYDCVEYSLLDSISDIFGDRIPKTLLKEHYRCHPQIIQFCNKQFYEGQLIPMQKDLGEDVLSLVITAEGNHMRSYRNQREIESVLEAKEKYGVLEGQGCNGKSSIGFIAPYNNQVDLAEKMMNKNIVKNTIHKFQGRECDEIIFSTVLDKKAISQRQMDFVDHAELVNVAVSRAKKRFTLVTGKDVFTKNNKYISALMRYIEYYAIEKEIYKSPVISAFDLLYSEYDKSLERLANKLNTEDSPFKSEQIVASLLRECMEELEVKNWHFHKQVFLSQLVSAETIEVTEREVNFMKNRASCDFVLYYNIGKKPVAVIEVDGGSHDKPEQIERDQLKNNILRKAELPLLRLRTTDSGIKSKLKDFIRANIE